jgi:cytoskeletal protein RodZ
MAEYDADGWQQVLEHEPDRGAGDADSAAADGTPEPWYRNRVLLALWALMVALLLTLVIYGIVELSPGGGETSGPATTSTTPTRSSTTTPSSTTSPSTTSPSTTTETPPPPETPEQTPEEAPPPANNSPSPAPPPRHHHHLHLPHLF